MLNRITGVTVLLIALGVLVWMYGNARYATGGADCRDKQTRAVLSAANATRQSIEGYQDEVNEITDIDHALAALGIMRTGAN